MVSVSVIVVVLNARDKISETLESITAQTKTPVELVVVDGGSSDGTLEIIEQFRDRISALIVERDNGIYDAMNKGIQAATGEWLLFLNAGDTFTSGDVLLRVTPALSLAHDIVCGAFTMRWRTHEVSYRPGRLRVGIMPSSHQAVFTRRQAAVRHPFDTALRVGADYDQLCRISAGKADPIGYTDVVIASVEGDGFSAVNAKLSLREYRRIIARYYGTPSAWVWYLRTRAWTLCTGAVKSVIGERMTGAARHVRSDLRVAGVWRRSSGVM
jgi:glycosyltransferase involved in cell wall biosynthesis